MSRYNEFAAEVRCPHCGHPAEIEFQADIGVLEHHRFHLGERVFGLPREMERSPVGPSVGLEEADFWAYGVGICLQCRKEVWARITVRDNRFDTLTLVPRPADPDAWKPLS